MISVNPDNKVGAVGFTTMIAPFLYPITLIKIDERTGEHVRDRNGVCVRAKPGEERGTGCIRAKSGDRIRIMGEGVYQCIIWLRMG